MNDYIELMERTLSEWMKEYPIEWIEQAYKNTVGEPTTKNNLGVDCISREQALNEFCIYNSYDSIGVDKVRSYLRALPSVTPQEPKKGHCKDCKWWKDNNGTYRRGVKAESQCPINRKEVYEGNGYCFLYEPQESEDT